MNIQKYLGMQYCFHQKCLRMCVKHNHVKNLELLTGFCLFVCLFCVGVGCVGVWGVCVVVDLICIS